MFRLIMTDLLFLLRREVIFNVEGLANLLGLLAFDHVGDSLTGHIKESSDVEIVSGLMKGTGFEFKTHVQDSP